MSVRKTLLPLMALVVAALGCGQREPLWQRADPAAVQAIREVVAPAKSDAAAAPVPAAATFKHSGGFVALSGRFKVTGDAPQPVPLAITKDQAVCAPGGAAVHSQRLVVSGDGGLANVCVYVLSEPNRQVPVHESAAKPDPARNVVLDQKACIFFPHVLAFHVGIGELPLKNSDSVPHNTKIDAMNQTSGNPTLGGGAVAAHSLKPNVEEKLPIPVTCGFHPWMKGWLLPRANGYFAVTDENGKFEIKNLPTGDRLTFVVWHEFTGGREGGGYLKKFTVKSDQIKPAREGFSVTLEPDKPLADLEFEVPVGAFSSGG
jgi:hypothetical protein